MLLSLLLNTLFNFKHPQFRSHFSIFCQEAVPQFFFRFKRKKNDRSLSIENRGPIILARSRFHPLRLVDKKKRAREFRKGWILVRVRHQRMERRVIIPRNMNSSDGYLWNEIEIHTCLLRLSFFGFFIKKNLASRNIVPRNTWESSLSFLFFKNKSTSVGFRRKKLLAVSKSTNVNKNEFPSISNLLLLLSRVAFTRSRLKS